MINEQQELDLRGSTIEGMDQNQKP